MNVVRLFCEVTKREAEILANAHKVEPEDAHSNVLLVYHNEHSFPVRIQLVDLQFEDVEVDDEDDVITYLEDPNDYYDRLKEDEI